MVFSPGLILILGGLLMGFMPRLLRQPLMLLLPALTLMMIAHLPLDGIQRTVTFASLELTPVVIHPYTRIFATVFALAAFAGALFGLKHHNRGEIAAAFIYAGGALGVLFAGDWITLFIFWEIMAVASTIVVANGDRAGTKQAALRYAYVHFLGGVILLIGILGYVRATGSNLVEALPLDSDTVLNLLLNGAFPGMAELSAIAILIGVLVNAAAPPFSAWLPDAYPESSPMGAVFLSAFTTKTAVFVLLTLFAGLDILMYIGLFMVFYGIIYAMLENDMRRILSYSIVNQVGFMVTGIGIGTPLALAGVATHAFCHIIYKACLLMSAGAVIQQTGKHACTEVGGLYRSMKLTLACCIIAALAISAFPLTSGFVSKSLISSAAASEHLAWVWFLLLAASAGVFLHAGIKFPWFVFFHRDSGLRPKEAPWTMRTAMMFLAAMCVLPALFPQVLYSLLPGKVFYAAYTFEHVVTQLQLLLFSGLAFFLFVRFTPVLERSNTISLDLDWTYRAFGRHLLLLLQALILTLYREIVLFLQFVMRGAVHEAHRMFGPPGMLSRYWAVGNTVLYSTVLLGGLLVVYYLVG